MLVEKMRENLPRIPPSKRIALTSFYLPPGDKMGVGYQAHYMANAMIERGHSVCMFSPAPRPPDARYEHCQIQSGKRFRLHGFAWAMRNQDLSSFDVLHSHGECHWVWSMPKRRRPKVHVRTIHGSCLEEAWHIKGFAQKLRMTYIATMECIAYLAADVTVAVSLNSTRYAPWIKRVVPNGVDLSAFRPGQKEPIPTILFVGTYGNRKRGKWLMELFTTKVLPVIPDAQLWMVCEPGVPSRAGISILGRLSTEQLADRFRRAWVFCLPSTYEGFGVPYIEALASGTAALASPNVGAREVLCEGKWGVIAADERLGDSLVELLQTPTRRNDLELKGLERAMEYSWSTVISRYEQIYNEANPDFLD